MKNKSNIIHLILIIFCSINLFSTPPPPPKPPPTPPPPSDYKLTVLQLTPCNYNSNEECLLVKRLDKSKPEIVRIKNFEYDEMYNYTLLVRDLKESYYKYSLIKIISKLPKHVNTDPKSYTITIEKDGFDDIDYIRYKKDGESNFISMPKERFLGFDFSQKTRYVLKVKEVVKQYQTYLEFVEQLEPKSDDSIDGKIFTIPGYGEFITQYNILQIFYLAIDENKIKIKLNEEDEYSLFLGDIYGFIFKEGYNYFLEVEQIGEDFRLIKIITTKKIDVKKPLEIHYPPTPESNIKRYTKEYVETEEDKINEQERKKEEYEKNKREMEKSVTDGISPKKPENKKDTDGDGFPDVEDNCPNDYAVMNNGCPVSIPDLNEDAPELGTRNILFDPAKSDIKVSFYKTLDEISLILKTYPKYSVKINGHTDNNENLADDLKLSLDRATSVKRYLMFKGIDIYRLIIAGFGETQPIADNKTDAGRAANRRVEIKFLFK